MFQYYTTVTGLGLLLMLVMLAILYSDEILNKYEKRGFVIAFILCIFELLLEWCLTYISVHDIERRFLYRFGIATLFSIGPNINLILAWLVLSEKNSRFVKVFFILLGLNIIVPYSVTYTDYFIYFYSTNQYKLGDFFGVLVFLTLSSCLVLFVAFCKTGKRYQTRSVYILVLLLLQFLVGFIIQFTTGDIFVLWINNVMIFAFAYIFYSSLVNQMDVLTGLLNRRSYENQVYDIKSKAIVLILDVNKFKDVNDTYGHAYGDVCLSEIGRLIKKVYLHSGNCYRIGGDEFCVILTSNLDKVEELGEKFSKLLTQSKCEHGLPTISAGYAIYIPGESSVQKTIEDADEMMYIVKSESRKNNK